MHGAQVVHRWQVRAWLADASWAGGSSKGRRTRAPKCGKAARFGLHEEKWNVPRKCMYVVGRRELGWWQQGRGYAKCRSSSRGQAEKHWKVLSRLASQALQEKRGVLVNRTTMMCRAVGRQGLGSKRSGARYVTCAPTPTLCTCMRAHWGPAHPRLHARTHMLARTSVAHMRNVCLTHPHHTVCALHPTGHTQLTHTLDAPRTHARTPAHTYAHRARVRMHGPAGPPAQQEPRSSRRPGSSQPRRRPRSMRLSATASACPAWAVRPTRRRCPCRSWRCWKT